MEIKPTERENVGHVTGRRKVCCKKSASVLTNVDAVNLMKIVKKFSLL